MVLNKGWWVMLILTIIISCQRSTYESRNRAHFSAEHRIMGFWASYMYMWNVEHKTGLEQDTGYGIEHIIFFWPSNTYMYMWDVERSTELGTECVQFTGFSHWNRMCTIHSFHILTFTRIHLHVERGTEHRTWNRMCTILRFYISILIVKHSTRRGTVQRIYHFSMWNVEQNTLIYVSYVEQNTGIYVSFELNVEQNTGMYFLRAFHNVMYFWNADSPLNMQHMVQKTDCDSNILA